jgi:hypothetical protein
MILESISLSSDGETRFCRASSMDLHTRNMAVMSSAAAVFTCNRPDSVRDQIRVE